MKKIFILLLICFFTSSLCLFADDEEKDSKMNAADEDLAVSNSGRSPFRVKDRRVEVGLVSGNIGFANNFLSTSQIFQERMIIDINDLGKGFKVNFDLGLTPLFFNYTANEKKWGFGLSVNVEAMGILSLSGNMLTLSEAAGDKSDVSGAAFVSVKASSFFNIHTENTKIKANLSLFYPVMYVDPKISYSLNNSGDSTMIDIEYMLRIYTPISMEEGASTAITSLPGVDIQLGVEYGLAEVLGLKEKISFLDFIVGLDLLNIPIVPSSMNTYIEMAGRVGGDEKIDIDDPEGFFSSQETRGRKTKNIFRPFKMLVWADWKPFDAVPVSFIPTIGFAINPLYHEPGSLEAGIKARFDLANLFIATLGVGFYDRMWKNSLDLILNFRFIEFNIGVDMRSQDFAQSWSGGGFGVNFGVKFGG